MSCDTDNTQHTARITLYTSQHTARCSTHISQDDPRGEGFVVPHTDERLQHLVLRHDFLGGRRKIGGGERQKGKDGIEKWKRGDGGVEREKWVHEGKEGKGIRLLQLRLLR